MAKPTLDLAKKLGREARYHDYVSGTLPPVLKLKIEMAREVALDLGIEHAFNKEFRKARRGK